MQVSHGKSQGVELLTKTLYPVFFYPQFTGRLEIAVNADVVSGTEIAYNVPGGKFFYLEALEESGFLIPLLPLASKRKEEGGKMP